MEKFRNKYRIESNRLKGWDYSAPGYYFITICSVNRECILGCIIEEKMVLSDCGKIAELELKHIPEYHSRVLLDTWVIMPDHIHLILLLGDYGFDNGIACAPMAPVKKIHENPVEKIHKNPVEKIHKNPVEKIHEFSLRDDIIQYRKMRRGMLIPKLIGKFKMKTSKQMNIIRNTPGSRNWQADYYDHIISDNESYKRIKDYIVKNPQNWRDDKLFSP